MGIQEAFHMIVEEISRTTVPEFIAVAFGMISVVLANRNHVALYPTGIVSTAIFIYLFVRAGLYAESLLNGYYLIMSIYGWALWQRHQESENPRAISVSGKGDWAVTSLIVVLGWVLLYTVLKTFTDSSVPVLDALVSCTAWAGMWLLAKHKVENWILLNISNLIAIPLLLYKHLPFTALLTLFLFIVAIFGYLRWKKLYIRSGDSVR